jgi:ParB family chromosome partitioning protein
MLGRGGLGRGLDSLIPRTGPGVAEVPVDQIRPNPRQPRHKIDSEQLATLVDSIREHGIIQPVVLTRDPSVNGYVLVAGERRWTAAVQAGLTQIPAVIKEATPQQMLELALVENVQRSDLNALEEATAYQQLASEFGLTQDDIARRVGRSRSTVANSLRLLGLPEVVRIALAVGEISEGHARALLGAADEEALRACFLEVVSRGLNVRQTEAMVRRPKTTQSIAPIGDGPARVEDSEARRIEDTFREALGTRVELVRSGQGGRLIIHFYGDEQLQAIYDAVTRT